MIDIFRYIALTNKMGIRYFNNYLRKSCSKGSIKKVDLCTLNGKTVVIDTSIYMYKFLGEDALIENMYLLISIFRNYKITPVFVFDGKPPSEKMDTLMERVKCKNQAEEEYKELEQQFQSTNLTKEEKIQLSRNMSDLKRQFVRIKPRHLIEIKELMNAFGVKYIEAESEADTLCAKLCLAGFAQACLSDDMDMFVYGIPIVLRHLSLFNHTVVMYDYSRILDDLDINRNDFKDILLLSKNDYNSTQSYNIYDVIKKHNNYRTALCNEEYDSNFQKWCSKELNDFNESEYEKTSKCFKIDKNINIDIMNILKKYDDIDKEKVKEILKRHNFIFV